MDYTSFKNRWMGQRIDYDHVFAYQCVDLPLEYIYETKGINGAYGNAIDWWTRPDPKLLTGFDPINTTDCQQGDIVVLRTHGRTDFAGDGHIGICDTQDAGNVWLLEQNGMGSGTGTGRDAIGVWRAIPKSRIAGILRPKPVQVAPLYTTEPITPKQIKVRPGMHKWNLGHSTFVDVCNNPITTSDDNTVFTAVAVLHHREIPQYNYYLEDANTPHGWNVLDCLDYVAPAPPPPPKTPPAAPVEIPKVTPYDLLTTVMYFDAPADAKSRKNAKGTLDKGTYIELKRDEWAVNIVKNNQDRVSYWINNFDNVLEQPKVEPVPSKISETIENAGNINNGTTEVPPSPILDTPKKPLQYTWIRGDRQPVWFHTLNMSDQKYKDLENPDTTVQAVLPANKNVRFSMMAIVKGMTYYIPTMSLQNGNRHGIPETMLHEIGVTKPEKRLDINDDGKVNLRDFTDGIQDFIDYSGKYFKPAVTTLAKTVQSVNTRKFVDGFSKAVKKKDKVQ